MSRTMSSLAVSPSGAVTSEQAKTNDRGSTLAEALATPAFWVFSLTISLWGMIYAGRTGWMVSYGDCFTPLLSFIREFRPNISF